MKRVTVERPEAPPTKGFIFWDVPEEFEAVDYTKQEDVQELVKAPDQDWAVPAPHQERAYQGGEEDAPSDAVAFDE
jgi:hypothetical protein